MEKNDIFDEVILELRPFIIENDLDETTVESLIEGSFYEIPEEMTRATAVVIKENEGIEQACSIKPRNIKICLKNALGAVEVSMGLFSTIGVLNVLALLKAIIFFKDSATIEFDEKQSIVLLCLYQLRSADARDIEKYISEKPNAIKNKMAGVDVGEVLKVLEKLKTVEIYNGKYVICENVYIRTERKK